MNSNILRIRGSDTTIRMNTTFDPVIISDSYKMLLSDKDDMFKEFMEANSEKQLLRLKQILFGIKENCNHDTVKFLVIVYIQADTKHPAKCMISRFVTKNNFIQNQFTEVLTKEIDYLIHKPCTDCKSYVYVISKVTNCIENFPAGGAAVKNLEIKLSQYFKDCLCYCVSTLSDVKPIAPTEKNEIFTLTHSTLRLLLHIIQKISEENLPNLICFFDEIRISLKHLLCDEDAPMDTKSVCGILYVTMHIMENNSDSWMDILLSGHNDNNFKDIFSDESAKLSIYSALVTVIPMHKLKTELPDGEPAIIKITNNILEIGERCTADATITLSVSRALVAVSRSPGAVPGLLPLLLAALWPALEHRADAVQHLAAHALRHLVHYCDTERRNGNEEAMEKLFSKLTYLDRERKSFYVSLTSLTTVLGAESIMKKWPNIVTELISALHIQAVQASATTALEILLQKHIQISSSDIIFEQWIKKILHHVNDDAIDSAVMNILESLLVLALKLDSDLVDYFLPHIQASCGEGGGGGGGGGPRARSALVAAGALRRAGRLPRSAHAALAWRGALPYDLLRLAAVDCSEENRILCMSLIVESPKSTEIFAKGELDLVLWFLKYNINAQEPHFRQQVLSIMKKFTKRLESSYKALIRENQPTGDKNNGQYYLTFINQIRDFCFDCLIRGANYSRRYVALQLLVWMDGIIIDGYLRTWKVHQIETLLYHLGDSYEGNKALALELLCHCPVDMLKSKNYSTSLNLNDILAEASSVKPTDCVTAVYKLKLLRNMLPDYILQGNDSQIPNKVKFALLSILLEEFDKQLSICKQSIVYGARNAPMYGLLHCIGHSVESISPFGLSLEVWTRTIQRVVEMCESVWSCTSVVLTSAAPEGHLPTQGDMGNIPLEDGKEVTAQMVLLCAWRSIKEVSLILGNLVTQSLIRDEFEPATLRSALVRRVGELFTTLLTETKHRGAFEQVYVGFTKMLTSLWRSRNPEFNELPKLWLEELMSAIESGDPNGKLCSTRRSAGLPFMIQALVITELQVKCNPRSFDACVTRLLRLAGSDRASDVNSDISGGGVDSGTSAGGEDDADSDGAYNMSSGDSAGGVDGNIDVDGVANADNAGGARSADSDINADDADKVGEADSVDCDGSRGRACSAGNADDADNAGEPESGGSTSRARSAGSASGVDGDINADGAANVDNAGGAGSADCDGDTGGADGAGGGGALRVRCHALNAARALVRDRALHERVAPHAAAALLLALRGFERDTWLERNSATLLFSALMVRIFGVQRTKDSENLCVRNRMTGRIFFLRYPKLYDFMLEKLKEISEDTEERLLRPSLYPILLLLARLYPSSLEGTVSNLKLTAFVPLVRACARSAVLTTRRLAARAAPALVEPERYISHIEDLFELLNNRNIKRNYCHGILLQLIKLLETKPDKLIIDKSQTGLIQLIEQTDWILQQSLGDVPCYLIADEYIKMINILVWRFDALIEEDFINKIQINLKELIFNESKFKINPGKELCLANAAYLHLIISHKYKKDNIPQFVYKCLAHQNYEVTLTVLNYFLILNKAFEVENNFQKHLYEISDGLNMFENDIMYIENLCIVLKASKYLECTQKCLKLLTLKSDTTKTIIKCKIDENGDISDDLVIDKLLYYIDNEHENLAHFYLGTLCNFLCSKMAKGDVNEMKLLEAMRVIFSCSLPDNSDEMRTAVVEFLEKSLNMVSGLLNLNLNCLSEEDQFELQCLSWGCVASALHDDDAALRARLARTLARAHCSHAQTPTMHTCTAHGLLRQLAQRSAVHVLVLLALLDFRVEVCATDDLDLECRVFDQNEKYNIYLEETIWTRDCARKIKEICKEENICEYLYNLINVDKYRKTFEKLCGDNFTMFEKSIKGSRYNISPKVEIFVNTLKNNYQEHEGPFL